MTDPLWTTDPAGSVPGFSTDGDIALAVPTGPTSVDAFAGPFGAYMATVLDEIGRLYARFRSNVVFLDRFTPASGWGVQAQRIRVIGEVWGHVQLRLVRTGGDIALPVGGDITPNMVVGTLDSSVVPKSEAHLGAVDTGRLHASYALNDGSVKLGAIQVSPGADGHTLHNGEVLTFAGMYPLDVAYDSTPPHA